MAKPFGRVFGQDLMRGEHEMAGGGKVNRAIPGVGMGENSAYMFRQPDGSYATGEAAQVEGSGTSVFDPVLCELMYLWFCPPAGQVVDPFAGGSVRGIVAAYLGYRYWGCELRAEQVVANESQRPICDGATFPPVWVCGDSRQTLADAPLADFVFTCPPYGDLERYSDDPRDLSTLPYNQFLYGYKVVLQQAVKRLKPDRFLCLVVGDYRAPSGEYRGFVADTVLICRDLLGLKLYNEAILITAIGSLPVRVGSQFTSGRKLGKTHQNVLVFVKGDWRVATKVCQAGRVGGDNDGGGHGSPPQLSPPLGSPSVHTDTGPGVPPTPA